MEEGMGDGGRDRRGGVAGRREEGRREDMSVCFYVCLSMAVCGC